MIEAAAGLLDNASPETGSGQRPKRKRLPLGEKSKRCSSFMSPGRAVTEKCTSSSPNMNHRCRSSSGGGIADEGEDIEVLELRRFGTHHDRRRPHCGCQTIMLLHTPALNIFR